MTKPRALAPALSYLFHRLEQRFTGEPSLLMLDESSFFFKIPVFAPKIQEWLKVLRKKNVAVVFATQSLSDITTSPIAAAVIESCLNKIYLANSEAGNSGTKPLYESFGLNATEISTIAGMTPKRQYYYKSPLGSRLFELGLGPIALAYCGASTPQDQQMVQQLLQKYGQTGFNEAWLNYQQLPEAAVKIAQIKKIGGVA
jgi:type IV secretion system protein TrbE